jgi:hypothetical protein
MVCCFKGYANFAQKNRTAKKFLPLGNGKGRLWYGFDFALTPFLATLTPFLATFTPFLATLTPDLLFCGGDSCIFEG